ncbi:hypothetical protein MMC11_001305 [Xylographa trunciseda]|nr:hypothetical protein [Xylographa trunciseda]
MAIATEESERQRIELLGRERPPQFQSLWAEILFNYSIVASLFMAEYFVSGFNVILPSLIKALDIPQAASVWPAGAFALVTSAFLLPFGRMADMFGGYPVYLAGLAWFCLWSLIAGFSKNALMLDFCRAFQGFGPAAFLPSGVMLLGNVYRPGPRKNLVFSLYGGSAPLGFFFGILIAGLTGDFLFFGWYFWIGAILISSTVVAGYFSIPSDIEEHKGMKVEHDTLGSVLIVFGLILVVFAVTDSSSASEGWATPYVIVTLVLGIIVLGGAFYVEGWVAKSPLIPFDIFDVPYIKPLFLGLFFSYGCLGIFLLYGTLYIQDVMGAGPLLVAGWFVPMAGGGVVISIIGGYILHIVPGTILILIAGLGWIVTSILFALAPEGANYWAWIFPAMVGATIGIDLMFNCASIFITTNLPAKRQGLAGALINGLVYLGIAFLIAFADVVQTKTAGLGLRKSYEAVFWYQLACSGTAFIIMLLFVRIRKAESDLTVEEKEAARIKDTVILPTVESVVSAVPEIAAVHVRGEMESILLVTRIQGSS